MHNRLRAGWRRLTLAAAAAAAVFALPAFDAFAQGFGPVRPGDQMEQVAGPEPTSKKPLLHPRSNYLWPFEAGPVYGEVAESRRNEAGVLHTVAGSFDLALGWPTFPAALRGSVKLDRLPAQYFVLQVHPESFVDGSFDAIRGSIEASGGAVVEEMSVAAFVVRLSASGLAAVQGNPSILTLEPYHPALKLSPTIGRIPLVDPVKALSEVYTLEMRLFPGEDPNAAAAAIQAAGASVGLVTSDTIVADVNRVQLAAIAALEPVATIHERVPVFLHGEKTTTLMQTGGYNAGATPYTDAGVDGSGGGKTGTSVQVLAVLDSGIQLDAGDFSDTRTSAGTPSGSHRKVIHYQSVNEFGGSGDLLGCDAAQSGGYTHGHTVAAGAIGNGTNVPPSYGAGWTLLDSGGNPWKLDGVAPRAKLVSYDAQVTPSSGLGCDDPGAGGLFVGDLYAAPNGGSLGDGYGLGAKTVNYSWGATQANTYDANAADVDQFLFDKKDAMVFISAGNAAQDTNQDGFPEPSSVSTPATAKNAVVVGASLSANTSGTGPNTRASFSSVGPVIGGRVAPLLMAPGANAGGLGVASEYNCRSNDNDQNNPVECDQADGLAGTSFSSPAAAGAAIVVRDYFAQGFYPDGTDTNPGNGADQVLNLSGALLKSILIASADWMNDINNAEDTNRPGGNMRFRYRFNDEQGYGRIQLNNVLPLTTYPSPLGLIVCDTNRCDTSGISPSVPASTTQTYNLTVTDDKEPLTIVLSWLDTPGNNGVLTRNLNLEVVSPAGRVYYGNYFTDDDNKDGLIGAGEGCDYPAGTPWPGGGAGSTGNLDTGPWSIPTCANSDRDTANTTEAVFLSNDAKGDGDTTTTDNQIEIGTWQVKVINTSASATDIGLAIVGPVQLGSSVRIQRVRADGTLASGAFICNDKARLIVNELDESADPSINNNAAEVSSRVTLEVIDAGPDGVFGTGDDTVEDTETGIAFTDLDGAGAGLRFESVDLFLTDGTAPDPGNGALDVRSGQLIRVTYADETNGSADPDKKRVSEAAVECQTRIASGGIVWGQFGRNATTFINGGCERDLRGFFTFGFPDKYMDADELVGYRIAFQSQEPEALEDAEVTLKAVAVDADSPVTCKPNTVGICDDPDRLNNPISPYLTILEPEQTLGRIGPNGVVSANFTVQVGSSIPANTEIEMVLGVSARKSGKPVESFVVSRHRLDVDEVSFFYSTDFPTGGTENRDINNNEQIEAITTSARTFDLDYYVESRSFSSLKANSRNPNIGSPWNFDTGRQGWNVGASNVSALSITAPPAQWGEDKNFNNVLDSGEDRDPPNSVLDYGWGTRGGCGWQTNSGQTTGGVWHTGRVDVTTASNCVASGSTAAQCQRTETVAGFFGNNVWWELVISPEFEKVNQCPTGAEPGCSGQVDAEGKPVYQVEFTNWAWNMSIDIPDSISGLIWELDTDTEKIQPVDLFNDFSVLGFLFGVQGAISGGNAPLTDGFSLFANVSKCVDTNGDGAVDRCGNASGPACTSDTACTGNSYNGTVGGNRVGKNSCFFEGKTGGEIKAKQPYGLAVPADDDVANGYCARTDALNGIDKSESCTTATQATDCPLGTADNFSGVCVTDNSVVDEFVTANGPIRNFDITKPNGPDLRFTTLEDFYGDSGRKFQAAMGFYTQEGTPSGLPTAGFGVAFDDQVIEWREFRLDADTTDCGAGVGQCATLELSQTNMFEGSAVLQVTVLDRSPKNDCNNDGDVNDPDDDADCDNDGIREVYVRALSAGEPGGETFKANETAPNSNRFTVNIPTSFSYDSPGTLFLNPSSPVARVQYKDWDDGTGAICANATDPEQRGVLEESTVLIASAGRLALRGVRIVDITGDMDGFADDGEEIELYLTITNKSGVDLEDVTVSIQPADATSDGRIACISRPTVTLGALANRAFAETPTPLKFTVGTVGRQSGEVNVTKFITFNVTIRSNRFDALTRNVQFSIDTDLNASGGGSATTFIEDFEVTSGFNQFTTQSIDAGRESLAGSNGYRCQYNDPDGLNSNSPGRTSCFMGETANAFDWHIHSNQNSNRAFTGTRSLHWGVHPTAGASRDTCRFAQLDAVRTTNPINIGVGAGLNPELSFKHQISLADNRITNTPPGESADRGVVQVQLADGAGTAIGDWIKIYPYENEYDARGTDQFANCTFDPVDDGNNEDSFFDPTDPFRRQGPSSTCDPEFTFSFHGDTDYRSSPPDLTKIGRAFDGPGLQGNSGPGTWVEPKFALSQYKGRRLRLRFIATSIEVAGAATYNDTSIGSENNVGDDGWYIDDVRLTGALTSPATLAADTANLLPTGCVECTTVTASLTANPSTSPAPGQPVTLSAGGSSADSCLNGALQFLFFVDQNTNGTYDPGTDTLLRDWTDNSGLLDAPLVATTYGVAVRCSSTPSCQSSTNTFVDVTCPTTGTQTTFFDGSINVRKTAPEVTWSVSQSFDAVQINGNTLRSSGGDFNTAKETCVANDGSGTSLAWNPAVSPGQWKAILLRPGGATFCNAAGSYSSQAPSEAAGRDSEIGNLCP